MFEQQRQFFPLQCQSKKFSFFACFEKYGLLQKTEAKFYCDIFVVQGCTKKKKKNWKICGRLVAKRVDIGLKLLDTFFRISQSCQMGIKIVIRYSILIYYMILFFREKVQIPVHSKYSNFNIREFTSSLTTQTLILWNNFNHWFTGSCFYIFIFCKSKT